MARPIKAPQFFMTKTLNAKRRQGYPWNHKSIIMTNLLAFYFFELAML